MGGVGVGVGGRGEGGGSEAAGARGARARERRTCKQGAANEMPAVERGGKGGARTKTRKKKHARTRHGLGEVDRRRHLGGKEAVAVEQAGRVGVVHEVDAGERDAEARRRGAA